MTSRGNYKLLIELWDWEGSRRHAQYKNFQVDDESDNFRIHVSGYTGNAGQYVEPSNSSGFLLGFTSESLY